MTKNTKGFAAIEAVAVLGVVLLIGSAGWYVLRNQNTTKKEDNKATTTSQTKKVSTAKAQTSVKLDEKAVSALQDTPTKTTPVAATKTTTQNSSSVQPATPNATPSTPATPTYSITISSDGCSVSGYSVPGNKIEIGAFSTTKGGSVVYDITSNQTITKSSGGFKGMTAFGKTTDAAGNVLAYHSAPITADSCPAAG